MKSSKYNTITEDFVTIDGIRLHYKRAGTGSHNILFTTGLLDWSAQLKEFNGAKFTMIAWCPPGYGHSRSVERVIDRQSTTRDAHLALHLMQHLSLTPFASIGWSEGGRTALHIAHIGRHLITHIVECGAAVYVHEMGYRLFNSTTYTLWSPASRRKFDLIYGKEYVSTLWMNLCRLVSDVFEQDNGTFPEYHILPEITQPLLILHGTDDIVSVPEHILQRVANSSMLTTEAGHDLHMVHYKWFNKHVQQFLLTNIEK